MTWRVKAGEALVAIAIFRFIMLAASSLGGCRAR